MVPLLNDLGLVADWQLISGDEAFFEVTKAIHNGAPGRRRDALTRRQRAARTWRSRDAQRRRARRRATTSSSSTIRSPPPLRELTAEAAPLDLALPHRHLGARTPPSGRSCARSSSATTPPSSPSAGSSPPTSRSQRVEIIPPAIDPESPKNLQLPDAPARAGARVDRRRHRPPADHPGLALRPLEGPARRHRGLPAGARERCPTSSSRWSARWRSTTPRAGTSTARSQARGERRPRHPRVHQPDRRRQRRGQRVPAPRRRRHPEVAARGLRAGRLRGAVEGHAGGRRPRRRHPAADGRWRGGFLVDTVEECAAAVVRLLADRKLARELAARGHERAREHFLLLTPHPQRALADARSGARATAHRGPRRRRGAPRPSLRHGPRGDHLSSRAAASRGDVRFSAPRRAGHDFGPIHDAISPPRGRPGRASNSDGRAGDKTDWPFRRS